MIDQKQVRGWDEEVSCSERIRNWIIAHAMPELPAMLARCDAAEKKAREAIILREMEEND